MFRAVVAVHHAQQHGRSDTRTIQRQRNRNSQPAKKMTTSLSIDIGTSARRMEADALQPLFPDLNPLYLNLSTENGTAQSPKKQGTMKVVSIAILRTGPDVAEPVPVSMACELSSYGFFQRQVRQALPQTNARKLKPWFSGLWNFFLFPPRGMLRVHVWSVGRSVLA